jgi:excisionase family DNA binding protein
MDRILFRASEVSEVAGIGKSKVYELIAAGVIPSVRIGKCVRVPADRLREWIEQLQASDPTKTEPRTRKSTKLSPSCDALSTKV